MDAAFQWAIEWSDMTLLQQAKPLMIVGGVGPSKNVP